MNVWWCNQSKCWAAERDAGVVCGCKHDVRRDTYRRTVADAVKGDLTVHYVRGKIMAVSLAKSDGKEYEHLEEVEPNPYGKDLGWRFETKYFLLNPPIAKEVVIEKLVKLRPETGSTGFAITRAGRVLQGYFLRFSLAGLKAIKECSSAEWDSEILRLMA